MPGQNSGHTFCWSDYVAWLVVEHGSLAAVADRLAQSRGYLEETESIERALRRLRNVVAGDGGVWAHRTLKHFGMPQTVEARLRWMGLYHSRFTDLPVAIAADLLKAWDRPPVSESRHRVWLLLGLSSVELRLENRAEAGHHLRQAALVASAPPIALAERLLVRAFLRSREAPNETKAALDEAAEVIASLPPGHDSACLFARLVDQRGFELNVRQRSYREALEWYETIPDDGPPFAMVRRHNGMGWSCLNLGDKAAAIGHARVSLRCAGDSGSLRLRAMALRLMARACGGAEGQEYQRRARAIAQELGDVALMTRFNDDGGGG